jgi:hypothetical protein
MAKVGHARTLQRKGMLKIFLAAKILHVRIALPALAHRFIRQPLDMLQQMQSHHQPDRQPRSPCLAVVRRKMRFQPRPIDQITQPHQFMAQIDDVFQLRTKQFFHPTVLRLHSRFHPFSQNKIARFQRSSRQNLAISFLKNPMISLSTIHCLGFLTGD